MDEAAKETEAVKAVKAAKAAERDRVLADNYQLVWWFANRRLPERFRGREHPEEIVSTLGPDYIRAVDYWLASDRSHAIATYVAKVLGHSIVRHYFGFQPIRVPFIREAEKPHLRDAKVKALGAMALSEIPTVVAESFSVDARGCEAYHDDPTPRQDVNKHLRKLPRRERRVLRLRFGLDESGQARSLEAVGKILGVTKERVRQIQKRAILRLRAEAWE